MNALKSLYLVLFVVITLRCDTVDAMLRAQGGGSEEKQETRVPSSGRSTSVESEHFTITQKVLNELVQEARKSRVGQSLYEEALEVNNGRDIDILAEEPISKNTGSTKLSRPLKIQINPSMRLPRDTPRTRENVMRKAMLTVVYELANCARAEKHRAVARCICHLPLCTGEEYAREILRGESYGYVKRAQFFREANLGDMGAFKLMFNNKKNSEIAYRLVSKTLEPGIIKPGIGLAALKKLGVPKHKLQSIDTHTLSDLLNEYLNDDAMEFIMHKYMEINGLVVDKLAVVHYKEIHKRHRFDSCKKYCKPDGTDTSSEEKCGD